nr:TPA: orf y [Tanacetum cinerariifolium]
MEEPVTESDSDSEGPHITDKVNRVKTENQRGEASKKNSRNFEFRMPLHKRIPNKNNASGAIDVLNLDCISDLNERKRILEKWSTEISLILQTNQDDFQTAKSVLTLIEHKTKGNIQSLVKQAQWNEDLHGIDFFDSVIDVLYTMFVGIDYHGNLKFKGLKEYRLHCYIDTGASLCLASKYVFPHDLWENAPKEITTTIANGDTIKINQLYGPFIQWINRIAFHLNDELIIIKKLYGPFIQWINRIAFHLNDELIIIKKVTKAFSEGQPKFLESMKKDSKIKQIPITNIFQENIKGCNIFLQIRKYKIIEEVLDKVCSENPIDPQKTKGWMKASVKLIDPNTVVRVKPMCYSPQDMIEFTKQINELLDMKLIIQSKSPHMSPAFLVENEAEKRRGKKRMVVNYKKINEATIGDSHNLPNIQELLTLLRGKSIFSSFDCKFGFWQVLLDEESQLLTAFTCLDGHFQWKVVPFGLKQAP